MNLLFSGLALAAAICIAFLSCTALRADQVEMQNGDRYAGTVLTLTTNSVVLQSDVLGLLNLPRGKVATITLGAGPTNAVRAPAGILAKPVTPPLILTNAARQASVNGLPAGDTNVIKQVENQFLADAPPEAKAKFNELASGLMNGSVTVADIRKEAKAAADQLRAAKKDLGPEASEAFDGYLAILESFLRDSEGEDAAASKSSPTASSQKSPAKSQ
jgi:hypothetical protein